jgi:hypothetical protein
LEEASLLSGGRAELPTFSLRRRLADSGPAGFRRQGEKMLSSMVS